MSTPIVDPQVQERIEAARSEVRRAVASETVALMHPFDMAFLLKNPTVIDAVLVAERGRTQVVLINMFDRQFIVVDGIVLGAPQAECIAGAEAPSK